ncbi:MAG TPA: RluA family pseudouridine synthase [Isosphaeraceae bacterium]|jgi:23S rRNA pseudouridine1911/1915/1917 synthase
MSPPELSPTPSDFQVKARMVGKRIDAYLASRFPDYSRSVIQKVIDAGAVQVNGQPVKASYRVRLDDQIRVWLPELADEAPTPEEIPIPVVYEDEALVVVDKPPGMVTHPAKGHWSGTLVNALQFHFDTLSTVGGENRPGIVHRLDRDTSGLLIVAKDDRAHKGLAQQFEARTIQKEYLALVAGVPERDSDYVERPIGFHPTNREKMAIRLPADGGKEAVTFYEVRERFARAALVRCRPQTGRTHQIRIHLAHVGHPILADKLYSGRDRVTRCDLLGPDAPDAGAVLLARQALHAHALRLVHPLTGATLSFTAPLPADMAGVLAVLRGHHSMR